jgi:hypothetical protein
MYPVLVDFLCKFQVQLHHLTPNAIIQIGKFIWAITSYGGRLTADVFAQNYELYYQNKNIDLEGCETTLTAQFGYITFDPSRNGGGGGSCSGQRELPVEIHVDPVGLFDRCSI